MASICTLRSKAPGLLWCCSTGFRRCGICGVTRCRRSLTLGTTPSPPISAVMVKRADQYTILHMVGDLIGLLDALNLQQVMMYDHHTDAASRLDWWCQYLVNSTISTKAYYITGEEDTVNQFPGISDMLQGPLFKQVVPNLQEIVCIKDAAHFVPEEQPAAFNEKLVTFLADLQSEK